MEEEWRKIEGFPNYRVSSKGRIKSLNYNKTGNERILLPHKLRNGYLGICLYDTDKKPHNLLIHRLVALAFIPNSMDYKIINHKDENRNNNSAENLEWCDYKYNLNYGNRNSKLSNSLTNNPFFSTPVLQYSKTKKLLKEFSSISEAARTINNGNIKAAVANILKCCNGMADTQFGTVRRKTAYGYIWKYKTL